MSAMAILHQRTLPNSDLNLRGGQPSSRALKGWWLAHYCGFGKGPHLRKER